MRSFFPLGKSRSLDEYREALEPSKDWDWVDQYFFTLAPFFGGWSMEIFWEMPFPRCKRYYDRIRTLGEDLTSDVLSIRELEFSRVLARLFKKD